MTDLEVVRRGGGRPILLLHGMNTVHPRAPFLDLLAEHAEVVAPSHPGFGRSPRPDDFDSVYDLVHLYLDVLDQFPHDKVTLLGLSFGGWLAAEVAVTCGHRLDRLILVEHLILASRSGFVTHAEAAKGLNLFAKEVLPRLQAK